MVISTRTPEGEANRCPVCGTVVVVEPSRPPGDAPCPSCGHLLWFGDSPRLRLACRRVGILDATDSPFEARGWRSGSLRTRGAMSGDLVRRGLLIGLDLGQLETLIGEPDEQAEGEWSYGLYRGIRVTYRGTPHRLRVRFGAGRRVREAVVGEKGAD